MGCEQGWGVSRGGVRAGGGCEQGWSVSRGGV